VNGRVHDALACLSIDAAAFKSLLLGAGCHGRANHQTGSRPAPALFARGNLMGRKLAFRARTVVSETSRFGRGCVRAAGESQILAAQHASRESICCARCSLSLAGARSEPFRWLIQRSRRSHEVESTDLTQTRHAWCHDQDPGRPCMYVSPESKLRVRSRRCASAATSSSDLREECMSAAAKLRDTIARITDSCLSRSVVATRSFRPRAASATARISRSVAKGSTSSTTARPSIGRDERARRGRVQSAGATPHRRRTPRSAPCPTLRYFRPPRG
jgi:hypothetical protein